ncbi:PLDc N-terminal domain-containing protein [Halorubrum trueperi]|uniref:PLDc N-terminal domain-containing protein n=1 Tax=Halorubrum trueperi TaxID=2004704 RepID=A0ABD5UJK3_9EURY
MSPILLQGGSGAIVLLFGLLMLLVQIAIIVWVYSDAQTRSDQPAFLWAIVVFFAPFLGLVLYWLLGRNQ